MKFIPRKMRIEYGGAIIDKLEKRAINKVIDSQGGRRWTIGEQSMLFEKELANKTGVKRAVVTNSGSSALLLAMTALKLPRGSKVIIPAVNFPTAFNAILQNNLVPVVVDVNLDTLNIDLGAVRDAINAYPDVKAVVVVDIASNPVDLIALRRLVGPSTRIICDNCDGFGSTLNGRFIDQYADISCVSFHAAHIITTGEGGAVLTNSDEWADTARKLREWGRADGTDELYDYPGLPKDYRSRYVYEEIGYNIKPLELQCAMGRIQLKKLGMFKKARSNNFKMMMNIFDKHPRFRTIKFLANSEPCWFSFPILCDGIERGMVMDILDKENNIECRTIFSGNILKHPAYQNIEYEQPGTLTNADRVMEDGMFLSVHPSVTKEMINFIGEVISSL